MLRNFEDDLNSRTTSPDLVKTLKRTSDADTGTYAQNGANNEEQKWLLHSSRTFCTILFLDRKIQNWYFFLVSTSGLGEVQQKSRKQSRSFPPKTDPDYQAYRSRNNKAVKKWRKKEKARQEDHQATIDALVSENQQLKEQNNELKIELKAIRSVFKVCGCCGSK